MKTKEDYVDLDRSVLFDFLFTFYHMQSKNNQASLS